MCRPCEIAELKAEASAEVWLVPSLDPGPLGQWQPRCPSLKHETNYSLDRWPSTVQFETMTETETDSVEG